jgi:hypothetical protein
VYIFRGLPRQFVKSHRPLTPITVPASLVAHSDTTCLRFWLGMFSSSSWNSSLTIVMVKLCVSLCSLDSPRCFHLPLYFSLSSVVGTAFRRRREPLERLRRRHRVACLPPYTIYKMDHDAIWNLCETGKVLQ